MSSKRIYFLLIGVIILCFAGLIAGTYEINGILTTQATSLTSLKAKSAAFSQEQQSLAATKLQVKKYATLEEIAKSVVPQDKDQAEAIREIVNLANQYGISLAAISFPASSLGATATASTPASASATTQAPVKSISQLVAVKNIPGVYQLTITVQGDSNKPVPYDKFISFLTALEHNRRTAQVSAITLQPSSVNRNLLSFNLTLNEYIKP